MDLPGRAGIVGKEPGASKQVMVFHAANRLAATETCELGVCAQGGSSGGCGRPCMTRPFLDQVSYRAQRPLRRATMPARPSACAHSGMQATDQFAIERRSPAKAFAAGARDVSKSYKTKGAVTLCINRAPLGNLPALRDVPCAMTLACHPFAAARRLSPSTGMEVAAVFHRKVRCVTDKRTHPATRCSRRKRSRSNR
jgi:hypothetical protein